MEYIDPHIHMISRVTDDYQRMAQCGCVAVSEPAFWAGFDRGSASGFHDYFRHLTDVEPKRALQFGVRHYAWLCINAKEAESVPLAREVIRLIPEFLDRPNVLGIGEVGLNKNTINEATVFEEHLELVVKFKELMLVHTPHLADKYRGTRMIIDMLESDSRIDPRRVCIDHVEEHTIDMLESDSRIDPRRVCIDHVEEHTIRLALDRGFWCGMTLYPTTKCTPERAIDMIEKYPNERLLVNSAGDWGRSNPLAVPELIMEMRRRGHSDAAIRKVVYDNPRTFFGQCRRQGCGFFAEPLNGAAVDAAIRSVSKVR
jgi:predicted metal-dependent TIM-barrel fold hydrolase